MTIHPSFFDFPQWPPLPHPLTELRLSNQAEWGLDEWRLYAKILEMGGEYLLYELLDTQKKLTIAKENASRSKKTPTTETVPEILPGKTLLTTGTPCESTDHHPPIAITFCGRVYNMSNASANYKPPKPMPKRGRKSGGEAAEIALLVMQIRTEIETTGERITDKKALSTLKRNIGRRNWKHHVDDRSIFNAITKMRNKADN